jgi:hypothetical protein
MINELLKFEKSQNDVGLLIEDKWHIKLKANAKGAKHYLIVRVNKDGTVSSVEQLAKDTYLSKRHYEFDFKNTALTFKKSPAELKVTISKIKSSFKNVTKLYELVRDSNPKLDALLCLSESLSKTDPGKFWKKIILQFPMVENEECYISLEVSSEFDFPVQSIAFMEIINDRLFEINKCDQKVEDNQNVKLDYLGLPNPIYDSFNCKGKKQVYLYSRNVNNRCYTRYGKNGADLCSFSNEARNKLCRIYITVEKNCTEFKLSNSKSKSKSKIKLKPEPKLYIYNTLNINDAFIDEKFENIEVWNEYVNNLTNRLLNIKTDNSDMVPGEIIAFRQPPKGPLNIEYRKIFTTNGLNDCFTSLNAGCQYFATVRKPKLFRSDIPSIFQLTRTLSSRWKVCDKQCQVSHVSKMWSLFDSFDLFAGSQVALKKAAKIVARFIVPTLIKCVEMQNPITPPFEFNFVFSIFGIILSKEGIMLDDLENKPMFCAGRLLHEADRIHEAFFTTRNRNPPKVLIGQDFARRAYDNPLKAVSDFQRQFHKYLIWAEALHNSQKRDEVDLERSFSLKTYRTMLQKMGEQLPFRPSDMDKILFAIGFSHRKQIVSAVE